MATKGRHYCVERSLRYFLMQQNTNSVLLIYNNSDVPQTLGEFPGSDRVILVNNHIDQLTGEPYTNLGAVYRDAMGHVPAACQALTFFDDDDIYHPEHFTQGVFCLGVATEMRMMAFKPHKSLFKYVHNVTLENNTMEPSIFVTKAHIEQHGFGMETGSQHIQWINPLVWNCKILDLIVAKPTLIYNWGDNFPVYKISGDIKNPVNFDNFARHSQDHGDGVIKPIDEQAARNYYGPFQNFI